MTRFVIIAFVILLGGSAWAGVTDGGGQSQPQASPDISFEPASLDFGEQVAKQVSRPRRVTLTNSGQANLYINSVSLGGDNATDFALAGDTCTGKTIAAGKSGVLDVVMTPTETGPRKAKVVVTCNAPGGTREIALTGSGINSAAVPPR